MNDYQFWERRVRDLVVRKLGIDLASLPPLPLQAGFEAGDTPAEFFAGCVVDAAEQLGVRENEDD